VEPALECLRRQPDARSFFLILGVWNNLPDYSFSVDIFKRYFKTFLFPRYQLSDYSARAGLKSY